MVQDEEGRWMRTTVARPVSDPALDEEGAIMGEIQVPNNRCSGSSPMTMDSPQEEQLQVGEQGNSEDPPQQPDAGNGGDAVAKKEEDEVMLAKGPGADDILLDVVNDNLVGVVPLVKSPAPRRRLHGKSTVVNETHQVPALYAYRAGGRKRRMSQSSKMKR